jgi:hypothetical protein
MPLSSIVSWVSLAGGFLLLGASGAVGFDAWRRCAMIRQSRSWPTIKADVAYTDIDTDYNANMEVTVYAPKVWYRYQVGTETYEHKIDLPTSIERETAETIRAPYRKKRTLIVRYDPRHPRRAVYEGQTVSMRDLGMVAVAVCGGLIGIALMTAGMGDF